MILDFVIEHKWVILFYLVIILLIIWKRKKIDVQSRIIFLYRSRLGINWMNKVTSKHRELLKIIGYCGVGIAYAGGIFLIASLIKMFIDLFTVPGASSGVTLVLPGVNIPGIGVLPFWYWVISIFVIAVVHEFAHGLVVRAHNLSVKSTGVGMFLIFPIAFVEPDEKQLEKQTDIKQYSVLAAGSFANILLAFFALLLAAVLFSPVINAMTEPAGMSFAEVEEGMPAASAGMAGGMIVTQLDGKNISSYEDFALQTACWKQNQTLEITANRTRYAVTTAGNETKPLIGITGIKSERIIKLELENNWFMKGLYSVIVWLKDLMFWLFLLSLGIGLFNLLPIGPLDGGRMLRLNLWNIKGKERGDMIWKRITILLVLLVLFMLLFPFLSKLFGV